MIGYLEQLERDLVEAIDRREATLPLVRPRRRLRMSLVVAAALVVGIGIGIAIHRFASENQREIPAVPPRPTAIPTPPPLRDAVGTPGTLGFRGDFVRFPDGTWRGVAAGTGIRSGTLIIRGRIELRNLAKHVIRWRWVTPRGTVSGCIVNTMYRRPGGRWVWDGLGHVTTATGTLARWRGTAVGFGGRTYVDDLEHARLTAGPLRDDLLAAQAALPPEQRDAVALRVLHERSYEEVAVALGCTAASARQRVFRGLRTMRERMGEVTP